LLNFPFEDFVERLLEGYTRLKAEIRQQEQELQAQQVENEQLRQQVGEMESERGDLGSRVSSLIDRIETWESELEAAEYETDQSKESALVIESTEVDSEKQTDDQDEDEAGGGVQGSLFTATSTSS